MNMRTSSTSHTRRTRRGTGVSCIPFFAFAAAACCAVVLLSLAPQAHADEPQVQLLGMDGNEGIYRVICPDGTRRSISQYFEGYDPVRYCAHGTRQETPPCRDTSMDDWSKDTAGKWACSL